MGRFTMSPQKSLTLAVNRLTETRSFAEAARQLGVSQPAVSQTIHLFEGDGSRKLNDGGIFRGRVAGPGRIGPSDRQWPRPGSGQGHW